MKTVTLTAHFDGEHIQLDEPFQFPAEARLLVTVLPEPAAATSGSRYPLRGTPVTLLSPTDPVADADWEAAG